MKDWYFENKELSEKYEAAMQALVEAKKRLSALTKQWKKVDDEVYHGFDWRLDPNSAERSEAILGVLDGILFDMKYHKKKLIGAEVQPDIIYDYEDGTLIDPDFDEEDLKKFFKKLGFNA